MDSIIEVAVAIVGGALAVMFFRFAKPNVKKENTAVIIKVDKLEKENKELEAKVEENKTHASSEIEAMEKDKAKDLTAEELADYFNNRKH